MSLPPPAQQLSLPACLFKITFDDALSKNEREPIRGESVNEWVRLRTILPFVNPIGNNFVSILCRLEGIKLNKRTTLHSGLTAAVLVVVDTADKKGWPSSAVINTFGKGTIDNKHLA